MGYVICTIISFLGGFFFAALLGAGKTEDLYRRVLILEEENCELLELFEKYEYYITPDDQQHIEIMKKHVSEML